MSILVPVSVFGFIVFSAIGVYWLMSRKSSVAGERLEQMRRGNSQPELPVTESITEKLVEHVVEPVNRLVPPSPAEAKKLQKKLLYAGYRSPQAPVVYRVIQLASMVGIPGITFLSIIASGRAVGDSLMWIVIAVGAGYLLPRYILDQFINGRQQRLRWGLADALDLLVVSVEAGLGINAALVRVSQEVKRVHPEISEEFEMVNLEIRVGRDRADALRNLSERTGVEDLRGLCAMLIQADRFGSSIARAIRVYSDSLRTKRRQRAEQSAQKAAIKLLFPLAVFLFPTLFIALLGPAVLQLMDNFFKK